jgi:RNA polymerase sigma factor (sigma-70 family)
MHFMRITDNEKDLALWNQFKHGDEEAFVTLFRNYYPGLFNYGCKITSDNDLVEDCIQELFLEIWRSNGKADILSMRAYIFKAFKFKLVRLITKNNKVQSYTAVEHAFELSHENFIIDKEISAIKKEKILAALEELSPRQKEIIYLKFYQDLSYEEVSEIMQINYQAARNLIYQAIKLMKKTISFQLVFGLLIR